jgi:very-short-patch-repair endonuclease
MSDDDKAERSKIAKINWDSMTDEEKENLRKKAGKAVRDAAENGSKLERFLLIELQRKGYKVNFHKTNVVTNEELEMDLFLPETNPPIAIEVDGPAHFFPIWGEESLAKHITADNQKNGLLIESGYKVIRIKHLVKNLSEIHKRKVLTSLLEVLSSIESGSENNLFEIEVK